MNEREWIYEVTWAFYEKVKLDVLIGYHFRNIEDFNLHIPRIASFWEIQLLGSTLYEVNPPFDMLGVHSSLGIKRGELGRWMVLFRKTLEEKKSLAPENLQERWEERLQFFQGVFSRFFGI